MLQGNHLLIYRCFPKYRGGLPLKSFHLFIGFGTIIFTIHFGGYCSPICWKLSVMVHVHQAPRSDAPVVFVVVGEK